MATQFCTVANVNERVNQAADADAAVLGTIIDAVSIELARHAKRANASTNLMLRESARVELTQGNGGNMLFLDVWPVESITSIIVATDVDYTNGETLTANDDYRFDADWGVVFRQAGNWTTSYKSIQVGYTGGYLDPTGTPTGNQVPLPADVIEAAIVQSVHRYQRRTLYGAKSIEGESGELIYHQATPLLSSVAETMSNYRREVFY